MRVITRDFFDEEGRKGITVVPLGDIHIGSANCDEERLKAEVARIRDEGWYFIGMGDYCEFISVRDSRFSLDSLADWIRVEHLGDLVAHQRNRFLKLIEPIADRCLGMVCGNHERKILEYYERDVYQEIVESIRRAAGWDPSFPLELGVGGWLRLRFYRSKKGKREGVSTVTVIAHHGFGGGRLAGGKALNLQRWLWTHRADVVLFGHTHNTSIQAEAVEYLDRSGRIRYQRRIGAYTGSFLCTATEDHESYTERKGYLPLPASGVVVQISPCQSMPIEVRMRV